MTSRSPFGDHSRALLRVGLAGVNLFAVGLVAQLIHRHPWNESLTNPLVVPMVRHFQQPVLLGAWTAVGALLLVLFAAGVRPLLTGLLAFAAEFVLQFQFNQLDGDAMEMFYLPGSALLAWCLGLALAKRLWGASAGPRAEVLAEAAAAGVMGATYALAGASKLAKSGLGWADATTLRAYLLSLGRFDPDSWRGAFFDLVVGRPALTFVLVAAVLLFQLTAFAYAYSRLTRAVWGTFFVGFHLGVLLLGHIHYDTNLALLVLFSYPWPAVARLLGRRAPAPLAAPVDAAAREWPVLRRAIRGAAVVALAAWLLPLDWTPEAGVAPGENLRLGPDSVHVGDYSMGWRFVDARPVGEGHCFGLLHDDGTRVDFYVARTVGLAAFPCAIAGDAGVPAAAGSAGLVAVGDLQARFSGANADATKAEQARRQLELRLTTSAAGP